MSPASEPILPAPGSSPNYPSVADRLATGKALRQTLKRPDLGIYQPPQNRLDPVDQMVAQAEGRVPELVPILYGHTSKDPQPVRVALRFIGIVSNYY